ncbi:MAG: hypothetical protein HXS44_14610 [Theionarchaea archaeon]|nr:hypothetical protein [Theionarchaea archaeon]
MNATTKEMLAIEATDERVTDNREFENHFIGSGRWSSRYKRPLHASQEERYWEWYQNQKKCFHPFRGISVQAKYARELKKIGYKAWKRSTSMTCAGHQKGISQQLNECLERI